MNKKGFTLIELIITMGIVGVVAALVAPGVIISNRNAANASKLSTTVSDLTNALSTMPVKEQVDDLYQTDAWQAFGSDLTSSTSDSTVNDFTGHLSKYINIVPDTTYKSASSFYAENKAYDLANDGGKGDVHDFSSGNGSNGRTFLLKNGAVIFAYLTAATEMDEDELLEQEEKIIQAGGMLKSVAGELMIDVNGKGAPNTIGRDIFYFYINSDGTLYPSGGWDYSAYLSVVDSVNHSGGDVWYLGGGSTTCTDSSKANGGWGCTARLMEKGYKMDY